MANAHTTAGRFTTVRPSQLQLRRRKRQAFIDSALIVVTVISIPFQDALPAPSGVSVSAWLFACLLLYLGVVYPRALFNSRHLAITAAFASFLFICAFTEIIVHDNSRFSDLIRYTKSYVGAFTLYTMCIVQPLSRRLLDGIVLAGLLIAALLILFGAEALTATVTSSAPLAGDARRAELLNGLPLSVGSNAQAHMLALAFVCVFLAAMESKAISTLSWILMGILGVGLLISLCRGAIISTLFGCGWYFARHRGKTNRMLVFALFVGGAISLFGLPDLLFARMTSVLEVTDEELRREKTLGSRRLILETVVNGIVEHPLFGVGAGNYYGRWGKSAGLAKHYSSGWAYVGSHNTFLQVWINWGVLAFAALLVLIWQLRVPDTRSSSARTAACLGICCLVQMTISDDLEAKTYTIVTALLMCNRFAANEASSKITRSIRRSTHA